jgi:phosphoribosylcarboxyaminoimidazole (NCAIR) mutase
MPQGILQQQDMGPLSDAAVSSALSYQNTPLENDIAYLASRVGPSASPEALALVEPRFVTELAREIRAAEEATGTTARINDMYRSPETQGQIYADLKAQNPNYMVAPAGSSWHQAAVAADIARSPVLNYMRENTPSSLNFPFGQEDLVHVQMSNPMMASLGINRGTRSAFGSTMGDGGFMLAGGDMGQMTPTSVASASPSPSPAPVRSVMAPSGMAFNRGLLAASQPQVASNTSTSVPAQAVMAPGGMSFNAGLLGQQILAGSQPQVVDNSSAPEAPPVVRPTGAPTRLASLLFDRGMNRSEERRRRKRKSTNTDQMQSDAIGGLLA